MHQRHMLHYFASLDALGPTTAAGQTPAPRPPGSPSSSAQPPGTKQQHLVCSSSKSSTWAWQRSSPSPQPCRHPAHLGPLHGRRVSRVPRELVAKEVAGTEALAEGDAKKAIMPAGEVAGRITDIPTVKELVDGIMADAGEIVGNLAAKFIR